MQQVDARGNEWQGALDQINGLTFTDPRTAVNTLASNNAEVLLDINGKSSLFVDARCGVTFNAATNIMIEGMMNGSAFFQLPFFIAQSNDQTNFPAESMTNVLGGANVTAGDIFLLCCSVTGLRRVRVRMNFTTAGSIDVAMRATEADYRIIAQPQPSLLNVTQAPAVNTGGTITLPAAGAGLFHYVTNFQAILAMNPATAQTGGASVFITTTNLPGNPAWAAPIAGNAAASTGGLGAASATIVNAQWSNPLKSLVANTATTFVLPAPGAACVWRANVQYYVGA
jgi:hypothetical protein